MMTVTSHLLLVNLAFLAVEMHVAVEVEAVEAMGGQKIVTERKAWDAVTGRKM